MVIIDIGHYRSTCGYALRLKFNVIYLERERELNYNIFQGYFKLKFSEVVKLNTYTIEIILYEY